VVTIFRTDDTASRLRNQKVEVIDAALPDQASPSNWARCFADQNATQFVIHFYFLSSSSSGGSDGRQVATKRVI
jgi:hypothetical protein